MTLPKPSRSQKALWAAITIAFGFALQVSAAPPNFSRLPTCSRILHGLSPTPDACPLPVDDKDLDWSPWSHRPQCFQPGHKPSSSPPYCLYTYPTFRGNEGLSLITTPELAASVADALDDGVVLPKDRGHPSSPLAFDRRDVEEEMAFRVQDLPGRGKGAVALRNISAWETVLVGFPVFVIQMDLWEGVSKKDSSKLLRRALRRLPEHQQAKVMALARNSGVEDPIEDVLRTNIFGLELDDVLHMGLFVDGSRVNHNCRPNVFWRYDAKTMAMEVVAIRDIDAGEEITHTYVTLGRTHKQRQEDLADWGFKCSCSLCTASPKEIELSDARRARILEISNSLQEAETLGETRLAQLIREMVLLIDTEQLWPQMVVYYPVIARAYLQIGDLKRARKYIALAEETWMQFQGVDHENVEGIKQLWQELQEVEAEEAW